MRAPAAPKQNHRCYASFAQRVHMATVLKQERGCDRGIPCVYVNGGPVLAGIQEDFCQIAVLEPHDGTQTIRGLTHERPR